MKLLLDTHTFLWFVQDSSKLSPEAKGLLESDSDLLLSVASLWEMAIKISLGKLTLAQPFNRGTADCQHRRQVRYISGQEAMVKNG